MVAFHRFDESKCFVIRLKINTAIMDVRECLNNETDQYFELLSQNTTQSFLQNHRVSVEDFINSDYEISEAIDKTLQDIDKTTLSRFVNESHCT